MYHLYTDDPVATLYDIILREGRSELHGISYTQVGLTLAAERHPDLDPECVSQAKTHLDWELDIAPNAEWTRTLCNLRTPGKEKHAYVFLRPVSYQFFLVSDRLHLTAVHPSADVETFDYDVAVAQDLLQRAASFAGVKPGEVTFILGNCFLSWKLVSDNGDVEERLVEY